MEDPPNSGLRRDDDEEPSLTKELCRLLKKGGYPTFDRPKYLDPRCGKEECDIVSLLPNDKNEEVWIEVKTYYTFWFPRGTKEPIPAQANGSWKNQICSLLKDCRDKLLKWAPSKHIAGLLLGFEMKNPGGKSFNPSAEDIDCFLQSQMELNLPGWEWLKLLSSDWLPDGLSPDHLLKDVGGWEGNLENQPGYQCVTRPMLLVPSCTD